MLRMDIDEEKMEAPSSAKLHAALFFAYIGDFSEARMLAEECDDFYVDSYLSAKAVRGWIDLLARRDIGMLDVEKHFPDLIKKDKNHALWYRTGLATFYKFQGNYQKCIKILNAMIVSHSDFIPGLTMKAEVLIEQNNWHEASEMIRRVLDGKDAQNIDALILNALYYAVNKSNVREIEAALSGLVTVVLALEPYNHELLHKLAKTFACLSGGNAKLIDKCLELVKKSTALSVFDSHYLTTEAYLLILKEDYKRAEETYNTALEYDESNLDANKGLIKCLLMQRNYEEASINLESLNEIQETLDDSLGNHAELIYLNALYQWYGRKRKEKALQLLDKAVKVFRKETSGLRMDFSFFSKFNAQFLLEVAREFEQHCPSEPRESTDPPNPIVNKCKETLELLTSKVPGSIEAQLMYAKIKYLNREFEEAQLIVDKCLDLNKDFSEAFLLSAQIAYAQKNFAGAKMAIERALSSNFAVKVWPEYNLLSARVYSAKGDQALALRTLEHALKLANTTDSKPVSDYIRASIYIELSQVHASQNHVSESNQLISDALDIFADTDQEGRIHIAHANIAAQRGDVDVAIRILERISADDKNYVKSISEMANIHLKFRHDKAAFAECYEKLIANSPESVQSYLFMGDAYLSIQEPLKAIETLKKALKLDDNNAEIMSKIGRALVTTHNYDDAIRYYENATSANPTHTDLHYDLAHLFMKLRRFEEAERVLSKVMTQLQVNPNDFTTTNKLVRALFLLSEIHEKNKNHQAAVEALLKAKSVQQQLLRSFPSEEERKPHAIVASNISHRIAQLHKSDQVKMTEYLTEAANFYKTEDVLLALAEVHLNKQDLETAEKHCLQLLTNNPSNERATMMLADIMFRKNKFEEAIQYFEKLLHSNATNFTVLSQLIHLLQRAGKVYEVEKFLKKASKQVKGANDAGLHYCKGLFQRYSNNPREALKELNLSRNSPEWGEHAIVNMIEIWLQEVIHFEDPSKTASTSELGEKHTEIIHAAEQLIQQLNCRIIPETRKTVLEGYILLAKRTKNEVNQALQIFLNLMREDQEVVPGLVGLCTGLLIQKQQPKARGHLKRLEKQSYSQKFADDFEKGWIMLANIYIASGKYSNTQPLLERALLYNKSCAKAWELMGLIFEKEQAYQDASECYSNAWKLANEKDCVVGYKLAFNYMKAKKHVAAIDICHKVLAVDPSYPRIEKEILVKAREMIRP